MRFDISRYRQSGDSGPSTPHQPPSSQADSYGPVPKTHRIMTLADHISVSCTPTLMLMSNVIPFNALTFFLFLSQHIITQDFAKSQDPPPSSSSLPSSSSSSSLSSTFQSSGMGGVVGRVKPPNRYSPENPAPTAHHQRPPSRVSPENSSDKPRTRYPSTQKLNCNMKAKILLKLVICTETHTSRTRTHAHTMLFKSLGIGCTVWILFFLWK